MATNQPIIWSKDSISSKTFGFTVSAKLKGTFKRKGWWSPEGGGEIGDRSLRFRSNGKANMDLKIYEGSTDELVGELKFYWKDFQNSTLVLSDGKAFQFKSMDLFRGVWSWIKKDASLEQYSFRVDNPLHRSGTIETTGKELSAQERDILLLLGLNLQHYLNTWLITFAIVVIAVVAG